MVSGGITPTPTYDANGNQTSAIPATLTWNALNQPITVNSTTATYDALGRMVEKGVGTTYTQFVYNPDGTSLAVYSGGLTKGTISLPGGSTAVYNSSGLNFIRHKDWLGSSRLATTWAHAVYAKEAYAPFGETYNELTTNKDPSFTGQDQNVVTGSLGNGVYDYLFRKYDPSAGRWLSPDPYGWGAVSPADPQSLNRYAYVENQPLNSIDPAGLMLCIANKVSSDGVLYGYDSGDAPCGDGFWAYQAPTETVTVNGNSDSCSDSNQASCAPINYNQQISAALSGFNQFKPMMEAQEGAESWVTRRIIIPSAMVITGGVVAYGGAVATVAVCATVAGCVASPITAGVALAGVGLAAEGVYYGITQKIWNPLSGH